ncbi:MAG: hypothetical protein ABUL68_02560 [Pseudomonadota bacterium]
MRILMLFADMLRPDHLHLVNPAAPAGRIDEVMRRIGGTLCVNAFTPAPSTGRSMACLWSARHPARNGCDRHHRFPWPYLTPGTPCLPAWLLARGYHLDLFTVDVDRPAGCGLFSPEVEARANVNQSQSLADFLPTIPHRADQFVFLSLPDVHEALDLASPRCGATHAASHIGKDIISEAILQIDHALKLDSFDELFLFSDHGYQSNRPEDGDPTGVLGAIQPHRSAITLLHRRAPGRELARDVALRSIMDIFPTIATALGANVPGADGRPLDDSAGHPELVCEDVIGGLPIWALIRPGANGSARPFFFVTTVSAHSPASGLSELEIAECRARIAAKSPSCHSLRMDHEFQTEMQTLTLRWALQRDCARPSGSRRIFRNAMSDGSRFEMHAARLPRDAPWVRLNFILRARARPLKWALAAACRRLFSFLTKARDFTKIALQPRMVDSKGRRSRDRS